MQPKKRHQRIGENPPLKTRAEVQQDFQQRGASIRAWAIQHKRDPLIAAGVISGRLKGMRGEAHNVAVLLGLKEGLVTDQKSIAVRLVAE